MESRIMSEKVKRTDDEWRRILTPEQYQVTRMKGTERPFSGRKQPPGRKGVYRCVCCGNPLFGTEAMFDSGTGWPSFGWPISDGSVAETEDTSHGLTRTEITCQRCDAHLGHVFDDGPPPSGQRYCMNSVALDFVERG
jgi:peptide-methionine (R)-S-oxide reductase